MSLHAHKMQNFKCGKLGMFQLIFVMYRQGEVFKRSVYIQEGESWITDGGVQWLSTVVSHKVHES